MKIPRFVRIVLDDEMVPAFYGIAWMDWRCRKAVCLPIPLNIVAGLFRGAYLWLCCGCRDVPANLRAAYDAGYRQAIEDAKEVQ